MSQPINPYASFSESDRLIQDKDDDDDIEDGGDHSVTANNSSNNNNPNSFNTPESSLYQSYDIRSRDRHISNITSSLRSYNTYNTIEDTPNNFLPQGYRSNGDLSYVSHGHRSSASLASFDYEALLTAALENVTEKVDKENKQKQRGLYGIIVFICILSIVLISTVTFTEYPQEQKMKNEIDSLEKDVDQLNGEVEHYQRNEDIDLLKKDINDKKDFIQELEHDEKIDPVEKEKLIDNLQKEINDLKVIVKEMEGDHSSDSATNHMNDPNSSNNNNGGG